jgi:hypothetical protein
VHYLRPFHLTSLHSSLFFRTIQQEPSTPVYPNYQTNLQSITAKMVKAGKSTSLPPAQYAYAFSHLVGAFDSVSIHGASPSQQPLSSCTMLCHPSSMSLTTPISCRPPRRLQGHRPGGLRAELRILSHHHHLGHPRSRCQRRAWNAHSSIR